MLARLQNSCMPPTVFRERDVSGVVGSYIDQGERDPALIACNTAHRLFRTRNCSVFPPSPGAPLAVRAAWDQLVGYVDHQFRDRGLSPGDASVPLGGVQWASISTAAGSVDLELYPWHQPSVHEAGMATPSTLWTAGPGDNDRSLVRDYLFSALAMAGVDTAPAMEDSKLGRRLRREARETILASPFNDARVTSHSAALAGGRDPGAHGPNDPGVTYMLGSQGRGLVWANHHYDDLARLAAGLPAKRGVDLQGAPIGSGRCPMTLYLPAVNLAALRGAAPVFTTDGLAWVDNGKDTTHPPSMVDALGVDASGVGVGQ
jgi:hypothetical protein